MAAQNDSPSAGAHGSGVEPSRPLHVAVVMDGNGRWAKQRGLPRSLGHRAGVDALKRTVAAAPELNIRWLTVFGFSTENWSRPAAEVAELMALPKRYFESDIARLERRGVRVRVIGRREGLSSELVRLIEDAQARTARNDSFFLNIAFNYGGQADIADAARHHAETSGRISGLVREVSGISEQSFSGAQGSVMAVGGLMERVVELEAMNAVFQLIGSGSIQGIVEELAENAAIRSMRREDQEQAMREALRRHQSFELVYITDAQGRQAVANIGRGPQGIVEDKSAVGRDWSGRPWFKEPVATRGMAVSEVYVSSATGENCITVSTPLVSEAGTLLGVLAADVNLGRAAKERGGAC